MRLKQGTLAPSFRADNWDGTELRLNDFRGRNVWLAFFRYASCPLCNLRVHQMIQRYNEFSALGLAILAVFESPRESIAEYVGKQQPPFPLITDPTEALYRLYELEASKLALLHPSNAPVMAEALRAGFMVGRGEGTRTRIPADFLIDSAGRIDVAFYGDIIAEHIPFDTVLDFARRRAA